jgi:heat shock protein HtpX
MKYIGLQNQIRRNNFKSTLLLIAFPALILAGVYAFFFFAIGAEYMDEVNENFIKTIPFVIGGVALWFIIAYFANTSMIKMATGAHSLERKENMRIYNLTENLCMSKGMPMPKLYVMETSALNAFASGIDKNSYAVTLTRGIIDTLNDEELEGVIAHELAHIRNKDVRLLIISIIFVGILSFIVSFLFRSLLYGGHNRDNKKSDGKVVLLALAIAAVVYLLSILFKFALSRKREYLADAGAVEMTKNSHALASALRKISGNSEVEDVKSDDMKQMFIENTPKSGFFSAIGGLFATHPPIEKRIAILEQGI